MGRCTPVSFQYARLVCSNNGAQRDPFPRIDVGGKLLTNHLKELVSFRQWNMMDETYVVNDIKEACCYVSLDFARDLELCRCVILSLTTSV